jgi:hypothetical protein
MNSIVLKKLVPELGTNTLKGGILTNDVAHTHQTKILVFMRISAW